MTSDFTVVFKIIEDESSTVLHDLRVEDFKECAEISELARLSEALKEAEYTSFLSA
jgi:hypothetical protein